MCRLFLKAQLQRNRSVKFEETLILSSVVLNSDMPHFPSGPEFQSLEAK